MRPVHQQQMYQVFNPSTRSLISIMSVVSLQICAKVCNHIIGFKMHISSDQLQPTTAGPSKKSQPGRRRSDKVKDFKHKQSNLIITLRVRFGCSVCGKHYSTSSNLARHRQAVLRFQDFDPIPCLLFVVLRFFGNFVKNMIRINLFIIISKVLNT